MKNPKKIDFISFNDSDRTEYLTGFHSRKLLKKSAALNKKKKYLKASKTEFKKIKRESLASKKSLVEDDYNLINSIITPTTTEEVQVLISTDKSSKISISSSI